MHASRRGALAPHAWKSGDVTWNGDAGRGLAGTRRSLGSLGLHARAISPVPRTERFSVWLSVGAGYARALSTPAGSGGFLEVPVGLGAGYKLRRPVSLFADVQSTFGAAHHGAAYSAGAGDDTVALGLSLGVLVDF